MRIRILRQSEGIMDGVSLGHLLPGLTYEVPVSLGMWLASQGAAEEDVTTIVGLIIPIEAQSLSGGVSVIAPRDHQDDRPPRRRIRKRSA
jgi:hypothetical protein